DLLAPAHAGSGARIATAALLLVLSTSWTIRAVGLHAALDQTAFTVREQWAYVDTWLARVGYTELSPATAALKEQLQSDATVRHPSRPALRDEWRHLFEVE